MVCAGDEQQPVMDLYVHASDMASAKSYSSCLWPKRRAEVVVLLLDFGILQTLAGVLLICPWAEISKGAVGLYAAKLSDR